MADYPPCKKCGKSHGMGIENMQTGDITPLDICKDCLILGTYTPLTYKPLIKENKDG